VTNLREQARAHLVKSASIKQQLAETGLEPILAAAEAITGAFQRGNKLMLCGNGGSAADCQHMAAEFVGRLTKHNPRRGLPAIALTTDSSFITAHANDVNFESIFERQVEALGQKGDVLIGITTSGSSANVVRAVTLARAMEISTVGLIGADGLIESLVDVCISIPSSTTQYIQEAHLAVEHIMCELVEHALLGAYDYQSDTF